jgi:GAF domain-containing protein
VATLVARGVAQEELFAAVIQEIGWLLAADTTSLMRFEPDDTVTLVAAWGARPVDLPIGSSRPVDDVLRTMRDAGRPWRRGPAELPPTGSFVEEARALGLSTFVGVPITVDGQVWGLAFASSATGRPFADDAEARLARFTELVATAIANAESRRALGRLLDEQAALRRVATLVARGVRPVELFSAVSDEVEGLFGSQAAVLRFEHDGPAIVFVGRSKGLAVPIGTRWEFRAGMASAEV